LLPADKRTGRGEISWSSGARPETDCQEDLSNRGGGENLIFKWKKRGRKNKSDGLSHVHGKELISEGGRATFGSGLNRVHLPGTGQGRTKVWNIEGGRGAQGKKSKQKRRRADAWDHSMRGDRKAGGLVTSQRGGESQNPREGVKISDLGLPAQ